VPEKAQAAEAPPAPPQVPVGRQKREEQAEAPPELVVRGPNKGALASLTPEEQQGVNAAIDRGVVYVRKAQLKGGTWSNGAYTLGYAALAGLTLLECGAPANDPAVLKAARFVRLNSSVTQHSTYQLSLAILFLDRLGEAKDRSLIRGMALRLIAGQNSVGGWDYNCPLLNTSQQQYLLTALRKLSPRQPADPLGQRKTGNLPDPLNKPGQAGPLPEAIPGKGPAVPPDPRAQGQPPPPAPPPGKPAAKAPQVPPKVLPQKPEFVPPHPQAGQMPPKGKRAGMRPGGRDDNSNTQFAILALWAARRHDVPVARSLALAGVRFRASQQTGGGWGYHYPNSGQTGPMTCVGLLGLAAGVGADREGQAPGANGELTKDPTIEKGLKALGEYIEHPGKGRGGRATTYFLWSVERVGVLYDLRTIGNKDWYRWGVEILLPTQRGDGSWHLGGYAGSDATLDTCMALLFLKRANLTEDLTRNLRLHLAITDPDAATHATRNK
jgi:hypothetical protein